MLPLGTKIDLQRAQRNLLRVVASFEFTKGAFVLLIGLTAILLVHKDAWVIAESLLALFHVNTDRRLAQDFLDFADRLTEARLWAAAQFAFAYSVLRFAEAYGLWKERFRLRNPVSSARNPRAHAGHHGPSFDGVRGQYWDRPVHAFIAASGTKAPEGLSIDFAGKP
jgi:hypothetical protein